MRPPGGRPEGKGGSKRPAPLQNTLTVRTNEPSWAEGRARGRGLGTARRRGGVGSAVRRSGGKMYLEFKWNVGSAARRSGGAEGAGAAAPRRSPRFLSGMEIPIQAPRLRGARARADTPMERTNMVWAIPAATVPVLMSPWMETSHATSGTRYRGSADG